ncbi:sensor domain-containing protein [Pseudomonas saliphila]|uniref:sensor domain-containing protein n=1 Tax=Pseudomonas saliphila TaxID=2586906 RepID=UPI00123A691E|nr:sensor domain-containing diguanylate cyclase [Pseudomonas saliphila]
MTAPPQLPHDKLLDLLLDVVCIVDTEGRFLSVSAASERVFGFRPDEMIGRTSFEMMHPDDRDATRTLVKRINAGLPSYDHENRYLHKNGHIVHIMWSTQWLETEQVRVGVARDITERKRAESMQAALYRISDVAHSAKDLPTLYARVHEIIGQLLPAEHFSVVLYDAANDELNVSYCVDQFDAPAPRQSLRSGTLSAEVIRSGEAMLFMPETAEPWLATSCTLAGAQPVNGLGVPLLSGTETIGALVLQSYTGAARYNDEHKQLLQFVADQVTTVIERTRTHSQLEYLACYDHLTQLPNRALFLDRLQNGLQRAKTNSLRLAVLYLDMDNFKQINDSFGHTTGDLLLREVAGRLTKCVRESDTIGRLGGDEFAILLDNISKREDAIVVAEKVVAALSTPYVLDGKTVFSAPSLGIAVYPEHGQNPLQLIQLADEAMYVSKRNGGRRYNIVEHPAAAG